MEILSALVLILLSLAGYSSGSVLGGKDRQVKPGLFDLLLILLIWMGALASRPALGKWPAILVWLLGGMLVGALHALLRRSRLPILNAEKSIPAGGSVLRRAWDGWMGFARRMGDFQGRFLLHFFYFIIVTPFAVIARLFMPPLQAKPAGSDSSWLERQETTATIEQAKRQF